MDRNSPYDNHEYMHAHKAISDIGGCMENTDLKILNDMICHIDEYLNKTQCFTAKYKKLKCMFHDRVGDQHIDDTTI